MHGVCDSHMMNMCVWRRLESGLPCRKKRPSKATTKCSCPCEEKSGRKKLKLIYLILPILWGAKKKQEKKGLFMKKVWPTVWLMSWSSYKSVSKTGQEITTKKLSVLLLEEEIDRKVVQLSRRLTDTFWEKSLPFSPLWTNEDFRSELSTGELKPRFPSGQNSSKNNYSSMQQASDLSHNHMHSPAQNSSISFAAFMPVFVLVYQALCTHRVGNPRKRDPSTKRVCPFSLSSVLFVVKSLRPIFENEF